MQIIQPFPRVPAKQVKSWNEIKKEAGQLKDFIKNGKFVGDYEEAFAISHTQVSSNPMNFFVFNKKGNLIKEFGSWCIINLKILEKTEPGEFKEACMSFPHRKPKRVKRFNKIKVEYQIPVFNKFLWKKKKTFLGFPSFVIQHEEQHARGRSIYFD